MHLKTLCSVMGAVLVLSAAACALPIDGSDNELLNPDFDQPTIQGDPWSPWQHGSALGLGEVDGHGTAVYCKDPGGDLLLRQVVDETRNPLWDWDKHAKWVDLTADILCEDLHSPTVSGVQFRLDWWNETRNTIDRAEDLPAVPDGWSDWVTISFQDIPGYKPFTWYTVNPFDVDKEIFKDFQPRWVSVEVQLLQGNGEVVWLDNLNLTSKCVPEPAAVIALFTGLMGLGATRMFKRK